MRNSLTITATGTGCDVRLGNAGGAHGMALSFGDLLKLASWLEAWREAGTADQLVISQGGDEVDYIDTARAEMARRGISGPLGAGDVRALRRLQSEGRSAVEAGAQRAMAILLRS